MQSEIKVKETIFKRIDELKTKVINISQEIDAERKESNEEDTAVKQDLIAKKQIVQNQIFDLQNALQEDNSDDAEYGKEYSLEINGVKRKVTIVHPSEADPISGKISAESPLAKAIAGKNYGDNIEVNTPMGVQNYKIV